MSTPPPPPGHDLSPAAAAPPGAARRIWSVGTLTYTKGGLAVLFSWLLWGDFAWAIRDRSVITIMQLLLKKYEVSDTVAGLLIGTLPASFALMLGPIVSFRSDRHRSPRGRRLPYLLFSAPLAALSIVGLGLSPLLGELLHHGLGVRSPGLYPSVVLVLALWWTLFDFATTITNAIFAALINDVVPAPVIGRFYGLFRAVSLLVGIAFNFWLLGTAETHSLWIFLAVGVIYGVGVVSMCLRVREGAYPPPPPRNDKGRLTAFYGAALIYFKECFTKPYYLWFFAASNLALLASSPVNLFSVFFAKSVNMSMHTYGRYIAVMYVISLSLTWVLGSLADRFHPLRVGMVAIGLYALGTLCGGFFAHTPTAFGLALLAHGVFGGAYFTGAAALGQRLLPQATFAQFMSASGIVGGVLNIVLPAILGRFLDLSHHNYRLTFFVSSAIGFVALGCLAMVNRQWQRLGGQENYTPP
jgi:MFS family permease